MANARLQDDRDPVAEALDSIASGRAEEAAAILDALIASGRGGLLARTVLVQALLGCGRNEEALAHAREASQLYPDAAAAALALGNVLLAAGKLPAAIAELQRALRIDPALGAARYSLACAWQEAGEPEKALHAFGAIERAENPRELAEAIARAEAMRSAPRSSAGYVRHLFDQFSAEYDTRMIGQLGYSAPQILRQLAMLVLPDAGPHALRILDLGCGTGLAGLAFADLAEWLDGVDLSPAMVEKARARGIYRQLRVGDIEAELGLGVYNLVLAADTLVYLGELGSLFRHVHAALNTEGIFLFTVERTEEGAFSIGPKRRWRHSENYIRVLANACGFEIAGLIGCSPRTEAGIPVDGMAAALRKRG